MLIAAQIVEIEGRQLWQSCRLRSGEDAFLHGLAECSLQRSFKSENHQGATKRPLRGFVNLLDIVLVFLFSIILSSAFTSFRLTVVFMSTLFSAYDLHECSLCVA